MKAMITGHRPPKLGGYQTPNPIEQWVRASLRALLAKLLRDRPDLKMITGMALGADQICAEVCIDLGIPFIAAVPFEGQEGRWPEQSQSKYRELLEQAERVVVVDEIATYHTDRSVAGKMERRNHWMLDHTDDLVIAVWNGTPGGTGNAVAGARERSHKILRLNPSTQTISTEKPLPDALDMFGV